MRRILVVLGLGTTLIAAATGFGIATAGSALGTEIHVGTAPGDIVIYGPGGRLHGGDRDERHNGRERYHWHERHHWHERAQRGDDTSGPTGPSSSNTAPAPECPTNPCLAMTRTTG